VLDARKRRIAENEARFREINDRLEADLRSLAPDGETTGFVCECGKAACTNSVELTLDEYRHVRDDAMLFAVLPGHEIEDTEDVLTRTERYVVVRKHAEAAPIVDD
jgi:hypothetical protein